MNPFFFGPSGRPLFGVYSHGQGTDASSGSVLLCYPVGSEYMRAHRAFRQLHNLLSRAGLNVLRFDYSCTGDSGGWGSEASLTDWLDDIDWALDEVKDNAMAETVTVVGLRWGATLAARACQARADVDRLVLWDPVLSGSEFMDQTVGSPRPCDVVGVEGFPFTPRLVAQMDEVELADAVRDSHGQVTAFVSEERAEYRPLTSIFVERGRGEELVVVDSPGSWDQADPFGDALIPQKIIRAIVDHVAKDGSR